MPKLRILRQRLAIWEQRLVVGVIWYRLSFLIVCFTRMWNKWNKWNRVF